MATNSIVHNKILVKGLVQGVGYRANAKHVADLLGVQGSVKNLSDGSVTIVAEATAEVMETFLKWCRNGPSPAEVREMVVVPGDVQHLKDFLILH
ncbi:acylphosphatase [Chitinophaga jiangningensis]|uniref:acylphosphatase n=1 Tax=Chitinophaga jiangningensis TaxID=1419482 RepID=A0A1M6YJW8_9BACT|nr:acylphosphatase [Chitinophaga jiangningensis]SHL18537.1 acylphosphatase [Chitinophaga jiangningensis]